MEKLIISTEKLDAGVPLVLVKLSGTVETANASSLEEALNSVIEEDYFRIIVDLSDVSYISSAGWGIFISQIKRVRRNSGDIKLAGMTAEVLEVFDLLEFQNILRPYPGADEAIESFQSASASKAQKN
jgi:anti-sigma B factor antagonist